MMSSEKGENGVFLLPEFQKNKIEFVIEYRYTIFVTIGESVDCRNL